LIATNEQKLLFSPLCNPVLPTATLISQKHDCTSESKAKSSAANFFLLFTKHFWHWHIIVTLRRNFTGPPVTCRMLIGLFSKDHLTPSTPMTNAASCCSSTINYPSMHQKPTPMGSSLCPSCQHEEEDNWHFLECTQADHSALFNTLQGILTMTTQKLHLHPCFHTALWLGLSLIQHDTPYPDICTEIPTPLRHPVPKQTRLGWDQLYQGCTLQHWAQAINTLHPALPINGTQIMTKLQTTIWTYILNVWKLHNTHLHNQASQMDLPNYQQAVISLYEQ